MLGGGVHDGAAGQEGLEIEPDMALDGGLAAAMFGPVQGTSHQRNGGRIHDLNEPLETKGELWTSVAAEGGLQGLQMCQHRTEELHGHLRTRVRLAWESVFLGGGVAPRTADSGPE